jgi:hypothetical protein
MLFSIYPTDTPQTQSQITQLALSQNSLTLFTSLHIPESQNLKSYLTFLKQLHTQNNLTFFADISPLAFERLNLNTKNAASLADFGIIGLRIDFGFDISQIKEIAQSGLKIAINASDIDENSLKQLTPYTPIGWHNYYPRPETGLNQTFFDSQNALLEKYNIPIYAFIPGEQTFRAPLHLGLPTLERHRNQNTYINFLQLSQYPNIKIVYAEGLPKQNHLDWINAYEKEKVITVPLTNIADIARPLENKIFQVRTEITDYSWRLKNTRAPAPLSQSKPRPRASLQMDSQEYSRYQGEIHIIKKPLPPSKTLHIADIPENYKEIVDINLSGQTLKFKSSLRT